MRDCGLLIGNITSPPMTKTQTSHPRGEEYFEDSRCIGTSKREQEGQQSNRNVFHGTGNLWTGKQYRNNQGQRENAKTGKVNKGEQGTPTGGKTG